MMALQYGIGYSLGVALTDILEERDVVAYGTCIFSLLHLSFGLDFRYVVRVASVLFCSFGLMQDQLGH